MKNNSKKHRGFTLIEVVISIAILSIMSIAVYDGLMIIIKQTKAGQVKQTAALEGKKAIEEIQDAIEANKFSFSDTSLKIGSTPTIAKQSADSAYTKNLDGNYVERITVTPTKVEGSTEAITLDTNNNLNSISNKIYISKIGTKNYISYWTYSAVNVYIPEIGNSAEIPSSSLSESDANKIEIYVYLEPATDLSIANVEIKDYKGKTLLPITLNITKKITEDITEDIIENLVMNFSDYKISDGSLPSNVDIKINMYNKTSAISNVYIEKQKNLNVNVEARRGAINIYDNRAEDIEEGKVGDLYDIKVEINKDDNTLFTGYAKKNIH